MKTIGIIGGMGPLATIDIFQKIVENTPAKNDKEHIPILIANIPQVPDRTEAILRKGESPVPAIVASGKKLEQSGADFLILACNTSHYYIEDIASQLQIPLLNMVELTVDAIAQQGFKKVAVIGTSGTVKTKIYQNKLIQRHIACVDPTDCDCAVVDDAIYTIVKAGNFNRDISLFTKVLDTLLARGAETIVLACTELPVLFSAYQLDYKTIDPTEILARKAIAEALA